MPLFGTPFVPSESLQAAMEKTIAPTAHDERRAEEYDFAEHGQPVCTNRANPAPIPVAHQNEVAVRYAHERRREREFRNNDAISDWAGMPICCLWLSREHNHHRYCGGHSPDDSRARAGTTRRMRMPSPVPDICRRRARPMRVQRTLLFLAFGATALVTPMGCSFTEDLTPLMNGRALTSGDGGFGADVAAQDSAMEASSTSESSSVAPNDGSSPSDATSPPNEAGEAGPINEPPVFLDGGTSWCGSHTGLAFCADLDDAPLPSGFSSVDGTFVTLTSTLPSSAPNALLLLVPPNSGSGFFASKLSKAFSAPVSTVALEFDFRAEVLNHDGERFALRGDRLREQSHREVFGASSHSTRVFRALLEESYLGSPPDIYHTNFSMPLGTWMRVRLAVTFGPPDGGTPQRRVRRRLPR